MTVVPLASSRSVRRAGGRHTPPPRTTTTPRSTMGTGYEFSTRITVIVAVARNEDRPSPTRRSTERASARLLVQAPCRPGVSGETRAGRVGHILVPLRLWDGGNERSGVVRRTFPEARCGAVIERHVDRSLWQTRPAIESLAGQGEVRSCKRSGRSCVDRIHRDQTAADPALPARRLGQPRGRQVHARGLLRRLGHRLEDYVPRRYLRWLS